MTTFEDNLELEGVSPDQKFHIIYRRHDDWELEVTGLADVETGKEETYICHLTNIEMTAVLGLWISNDDHPEFVAMLKMIIGTKFDDVKDYLKIIP